MNAQVDELITTGVLRRVLAFTDLKFSNSMIEAWWRSLKHQWLFLHSLDSVTTVRRVVAFYVDQHNRVLPHSAFRGQTPDEMYLGTGDAVPEDLQSGAAAARRTRVEANPIGIVRDMPFSRTLPRDHGVLTDCWTEPPRACTSGACLENGNRHEARVDRQNPAREQSRRAFQLLAACLTGTRAGKRGMSVDIARLRITRGRTEFAFFSNRLRQCTEVVPNCPNCVQVLVLSSFDPQSSFVRSLYVKHLMIPREEPKRTGDFEVVTASLQAWQCSPTTKTFGWGSEFGS